MDVHPRDEGDARPLASNAEPGPSGTPAPADPERLGAYRLLEPLGEGGMARVFLAQRDGSDQICVLKRLHVALEGHAVALKRFQREAHIASLLQHPAIARVIDAGFESNGFFLAMELIAGETLEAVLARAAVRSGRLPLPIVLAITAEVLGALAYAHGLDDGGRPLRIVHRDLTPRNVMITYDGGVRIIDFGIARGDVDEFKTAPGVLMGTPYYMSPEQAKTEPVDHRSDLYTFAAVVFEMLAGQRLVRASGRAQVLRTVAMDEAPRLSSVRPDAPRGFDPVLARALAKSPAERYASAAVLWRALEAAAGGVRPASRGELARAMSELFPDGAAKKKALVRAAVARSRPEAAERDESLTPEGPEASRSAAGRDEAFTPDGPEASLSGASLTPTASTSAITSPTIAWFRRQQTRAKEQRAILLGGGAFSFLGMLALVLYSVAHGPRGGPPSSWTEQPDRERPPTREQPAEAQPAAQAVRAGVRAAARPAEDAAPSPEPAVAEAEARRRTRERRETARRDEPRIADAERAAEVRSPGDARLRGAAEAKTKTKASEPVPAARPSEGRFTELHRMLQRLQQSPEEAQLRTQLHDRIEAESEKLPAKRRARIQAAIDASLRALDVDGLARGLRELEAAVAAGEAP